MKIETKKVLLDFNGKNIKVEDKDLTVGVAVATILTFPRQNRVFDMIKSYVLAQKFFCDNVVEIDEADLPKLKEVIGLGDTYSPLVSGQILLMLENKDKK